MGTTFRLGLDEVHRAVDELDPVALVIAELTGCDARERGLVTEAEVMRPAGCAGRHTAVVDLSSATRFLLPLHALRAVRGACLAAAAAQLFVPPGAATVSVLGSGLSGELLLRMVVRYVVGVSHVAVCALGGSAEAVVTPRVVDELDLAGISFAVTSAANEATFGANLVAIAGGSAMDVEIDQIAKEAVLVNGSGHDLPVSVVGGATIYVDNPRLIRDNGHRHFVKESNGSVGCRHRTRRPRSIAGDLSSLLRGGDHVPRAQRTGVVLVELLGAAALSTALAHQLTMAAHRLGLGRAVPYRTTTEERA